MLKKVILNSIKSLATTGIGYFQDNLKNYLAVDDINGSFNLSMIF